MSAADWVSLHEFEEISFEQAQALFPAAVRAACQRQSFGDLKQWTFDLHVSGQLCLTPANYVVPMYTWTADNEWRPIPAWPAQ